MKIKPFKNYRNPDYPDLFSTVAKPDLLKKHVPLSWRYKSIVLGALAAFVMAGCSPNKKTAESKGKGRSKIAVRKNKTKNLNKENLYEKTLEYVAPLFIRGRGTAMLGCVSMTPPVFTSERDAKKIIEDELSNAGINFSTPPEEKTKITVKKRYIDEFPDENKFVPPPEDEKEEITIELDNFNSKTNFGFEYISAFEASDLTVGDEQYKPTKRYDTRETAQEMLKKLEKKKSGKYIVFFYDPLPYYEGDIGSLERVPDILLSNERKSALREADKKKHAEKLLREQVKDFIKWAKKEGVLDKIKS